MHIRTNDHKKFLTASKRGLVGEIFAGEYEALGIP